MLYSGKNLEEVLNIASEAEYTPVEELTYYVVEQNEEKIDIEVYTIVDVIEFARNYVIEGIEALGFDAKVNPTLKDDIIFGLENNNVDPTLMDEIVDKVSKECGVSHLLNKEPSAMSGGQKQKGAIAGILALNPRILILDEASSMLDPVSKKELTDLILKLKMEKHLTIISITHDQNEILLADKIIMLDRGKVIFSGNKEEYFKMNLNEYNIDLPFIIELEKGLGFSEYVDEEEFFNKVGERYENRI